MVKVAAATPFFTRFPVLEKELLAAYPDAKLNHNRARMSEDDFIAFVRGHDAALIGIYPVIGPRILDALPELKVLACCSAGLDHIDPALCKERGVRVGWFPGINKESVSELAVSLMINLLRQIHAYNVGLRGGTWPQDRQGRLLRGRVVGIHGCGHIGKEVVKLLQPFGCKEILACDIRDYADFYRQYGVRAVSAEELWAESEIITIHLTKNASTIGLYNEEALSKLRPGMLLVNTARGGIVDEQGLKARLKDGRIAGAAFDVFAIEPATDAELLTLPNMLATPHIAGSALEAMIAMGRGGIRGITENAVPEPGVYPFD